MCDSCISIKEDYEDVQDIYSLLKTLIGQYVKPIKYIWIFSFHWIWFRLINDVQKQKQLKKMHVWTKELAAY